MIVGTNLWTIFLAVYGALVSTIALAWNVIRHLRDRGRLSVTAYIGKMLPDTTNKSYFVIAMTNVGRRPLMVKGIGGYLRGRPPGGGKNAFLLMNLRGLPKMLNPTEEHVEWSEDFRCLNKNVKRIFVFDTVGGEYTVPRKVLRELQAKYAQGITV